MFDKPTVNKQVNDKICLFIFNMFYIIKIIKISTK